MTAESRKPTASAFITHTEAIGRLVVAGLPVTWEVTRTKSTGLRGWIRVKGASVAYCFRDGTGWKVNPETVQDFIDENQPVEIDLQADLENTGK